VKVFEGRTFAEAYMSFTERLDGEGICFYQRTVKLSSGFILAFPILEAIITEKPP